MQIGSKIQHEKQHGIIPNKRKFFIIIDRKGVSTMSKRTKKDGGKTDSYINLTAAVLNLITALILLYEKLRG